MTAPLTPPHQPPHDSAWPPPSPVPPTEDGPGTATEIRQAAVVAAVSGALGALLGLLWLWLAPRVSLISDGKAVFLRNSEAESAIGADGTFVLLALGFGAVAAALVFLVHRRGGVALVLGLALGGILGSLLAWGVGVWFGGERDVVAHAKAVGPKVPFDAPLELGMGFAAMLAWPIAAMIIHLALTALFGPRDPEPEEDGAWPPLPNPQAPQTPQAPQEPQS
ncbi:DUF2567 domain-containing protein [Streptomyces sp. NPDC101160]|uniref:DUF2567 domain-containing protein n=1 Tax=Streptomyces sp. NPDC101160 TaxID=3366118 RepID=UPI00380AEC4E